jgi:hypothetical protein
MKKEKKEVIDWNDYLSRNFKWAWPFIFLFYLIFVGFIFIEVINARIFNFTLIIFIFLIMLFLSIILLIYGLILLNKILWRAKNISFVNYKRSLVFIIIDLIIGGWFFLEIGIHQNFNVYIAYIIQLLIITFVLISIITLYSQGSITDWYNNIIIKYGQKITSLENGYTDRPYTLKLLDPSSIENWYKIINDFSKKLSKKILIAGYKKISNGIIFYLPSTTLIDGLVGFKINVEKTTKITAYNDGNLSINISRYDYERIGFKITYHELCRQVLQAFADSITLLKIIRKRTFLYLRIATILTIVNILLNIGVISYDLTVYGGDIHIENPYLKEEPNVFSHSWLIIPEDGWFGHGENSEGKIFTVSFDSNTTIPRVMIIAYPVDFSGSYKLFSEVKQNVTSGKFFIETEKGYGQYWLAFDLWEEGYIISVDINFSVQRLDIYSPFNGILAIILIFLYIPFEYYILQKREENHF